MTELEKKSGKDAFQEATLAAEAAAGLVRAEDGVVSDTRPRDDSGRFVAAEEIANQIVAEEAPVAEVPEEVTPAETLLAGKYKTVEDLERGYLEAQAFASRQGNELGELRQAFEQQFQEINQRLDTPAPVRQQISPDYIEQNPAAAAQLAYEQGDQVALGSAYQQWAMEDPAAAATWVGDRRADEREKALRAEFEQRTQALEQRFAPIQQQQEQVQLSQGVQALPEDVRSFLTNADQVQALAAMYPKLGEAVATGTVSERLNAIQALYDIHRGRTADTLTQAAADAARTTAQEAQAVRDEAYVASTTASEAESQTWEQQEQQRLIDYAKSRSTPFGGALIVPGK